MTARPPPRPLNTREAAEIFPPEGRLTNRHSGLYVGGWVWASLGSPWGNPLSRSPMNPDRTAPPVDTTPEPPVLDRITPTEGSARAHPDPFRVETPSRPRRTVQSGVFHPQQTAGRYSLRPESEEIISTPPPSSTIPADPNGRAAPSEPPLLEADISQGTLSKRISVPEEVRQGAFRWLTTGELEISSQFTAREARSLQRAMLLVLMQEAPLRTWPTSLVQRASWLFRAGWDHDPAEANACLDALHLPPDMNTRAAVLDLIAEHLGRDPF